MSTFGGIKIPKSQQPSKDPFTTYYPHSITINNRKWNQDYYQVVSIDPAKKNFAMRIERRYFNGKILPIMFDKVAVESEIDMGGTIVLNTYQNLTSFLIKYDQFYENCHFIIIERQLPQNYKAVRISQHAISWFSLRLYNKGLLASIIEVQPTLKGKMLGAPSGITDKQLKTWAVEVGRQLLTLRDDTFSLEVLAYFKNKQDDLCDTVVQIEALFKLWGFVLTPKNPIIEDKLLSLDNNVKPGNIKLYLQNQNNVANNKLIQNNNLVKLVNENNVPNKSLTLRIS